MSARTPRPKAPTWARPTRASPNFALVPHLVAAPDKFRGTVSAAEAAAAMADAARRAGWTADEVPVSDGGEGLLDALGGDPRRAAVTGPLGEPVDAEWRMLTTGSHGHGDRDHGGDETPTAVVEMSKAAGRALLPRPRGDDPVRADTTGVGQLLLAARDAGARRIVIGCGGSATTDGGLGAVRAIGESGPDALAGIDLVVACDVTTPFLDAAAIFGPQKGATPAQVELLTQRLDDVAAVYRDEFGVDVTTVPAAGAAGGLGGGLYVLGARLEPGFDLVAGLVGLATRIERADLVATGEGHLDPPSFSGKVPGGVLALAQARRAGPIPVLCVVGGADRSILARPPVGIEVRSLVALYGRDRARSQTAALIGRTTSEFVATFCS
ncbi:MAG TPA: glycerate kinase [Acidimicrobiales bacterium]